jgi:hypothetical protein
MSRTRKLAVTLVVIAVALVAIRVSLPYILNWRINVALDEMPNYTGHLNDVDVSLLRGAYFLQGLQIAQRDSRLPDPFLRLRQLDITIQWKALRAGEVVGELDAWGLQLAVVKGETKDDTQLGTGLDWRAQIERLYPFRFNRIATHAATISFQAPGIDTGDRIEVTDVDLELRDLTNITEKDQEAFATFKGTGRTLESGRLDLNGRFDPNARTPTFDVNFGLRDVPLPAINAWLREYAGVDAEAGAFGLYTEVATRDGAFDGYVKPIIRDAKIFSLEEDMENPLQTAWEAVVAAVTELFENQPKEQLATRIPLQGNLEDPEADVFTSIFNVLRNAFVAAFSQSVEHSISIGDVGSPDEQAEEEAGEGGD